MTSETRHDTLDQSYKTGELFLIKLAGFWLKTWAACEFKHTYSQPQTFEIWLLIMPKNVKTTGMAGLINLSTLVQTFKAEGLVFHTSRRML